MITLTNVVLAQAITLPNMIWTDEFAFQQVAVKYQRTLGGFMLAEYTQHSTGRPITLSSGQDYEWLPRATLMTLRDWNDTLIQSELTLDIHGQSFSCEFDRQRGGIEMQLAVDYSDPAAEDFYFGTLRFITL